MRIAFRFLTLLVISAFTIPAFADDAASAESPKPPVEFQKLVDRLAGAWSYHGTIGDREIHGIWTALPANEGRLLSEIEYGVKEGEEGDVAYFGRGGEFFIPPATVQHSMSYADGGCFRKENEILMEGDEVVGVKGTRRSVLADGTEQIGEIRTTFTGPRDFQYSVAAPHEEIKLDFHRVVDFSSPENDSSYEEYAAFFGKHFVGTWEGSMNQDDAEGDTVWICEASKGGTSHHTYQTVNGRFFAEATFSFDPATKCWTGVRNFADGTRQTQRYGTNSLDAKPGEFIYGLGHDVLPDGTEELVLWRLTLAEDGENHGEMLSLKEPDAWIDPWSMRRAE